MGLQALSLAAACPALHAADAAPQVSTTAMESVDVTAKKLAVETLIDRKVYSLSSDVQATFGSVGDVLNAIPSVDVDPDGGLSLRGDANVLILIDGKPSSQFAGASAGENLKSMSAKDIERIEVITTPPAQFKADGAAGVINIITRRNHPEGMAGSLQGSLGSGGRSVVGANASYASGALTASATAGYRHDFRQRLLQSQVRATDPLTAQPTDTQSTLNERIGRQVPTAGLSADYALDASQSFSASLNWTQRGGLRTYTQLDQSHSPAGLLTSASQRLSAGRDPESDYDEKLGYTRKLGRSGEHLDVSLHRSTSHQLEHYDYENDTSFPPAPTYYNNLSLREDHQTTEVGVDYTLPLPRARSVKVGFAFSRDDYRYGNAGSIVDPQTGAQVIDPNVTNDFQVRQQVSSGYASYQTAIGEWGWLAGLRGEYTSTEALQLTDGVANSSGYLRLYPSLHVNRALSDVATLSFGASRRVSRPDPSSLNPYVDREYTPNLRAGNANLRPQDTQSYEVGYGVEGHGLTYQLTGYYRRNRDGVTDVTRYLGNGFSLTTKDNLPRNDSGGVEVTTSGRVGKTLSYSLSGNLFYSQIDATALGVPGTQSTRGVNAKLKLDYHPTSGDSVQLFVTRTDKRLTPQGYVSAINVVNIGYRHQVTASLVGLATVADVFNGQRNERVETTPGFTGDYLRTVRGRVLYIGLVYSFGATKKDRPPAFDFDQSG